jgi:hypothetical protein
LREDRRDRGPSNDPHPTQPGGIAPGAAGFEPDAGLEPDAGFEPEVGFGAHDEFEPDDEIEVDAGLGAPSGSGVGGVFDGDSGFEVNTGSGVDDRLDSDQRRRSAAGFASPRADPGPESRGGARRNARSGTARNLVRSIRPRDRVDIDGGSSLTM